MQSNPRRAAATNWQRMMTTLTAAGVSALLTTKVFGRDLVVVPEIGSTNTAIKQEYAAGRAEGFTLIAEQQTAGRGRLGRTFCSPAGGGLYMSVLLRPRMPLERLNFITIAAAVAVCRAIDQTCGIHPEIKWVNDIFMNGKKLCGILTEAAIEGETGSIDYAVLGIGANLRLDSAALPEEVRTVAGALARLHRACPAPRCARRADSLRNRAGLCHPECRRNRLPD